MVRRAACALHLSLFAALSPYLFLSSCAAAYLFALLSVLCTAIGAINLYRCNAVLLMMEFCRCCQVSDLGGHAALHAESSALRLMYSSRAILNKQCKYHLTHRMNV